MPQAAAEQAASDPSKGLRLAGKAWFLKEGPGAEGNTEVGALRQLCTSLRRSTAWGWGSHTAGAAVAVQGVVQVASCTAPGTRWPAQHGADLACLGRACAYPVAIPHRLWAFPQAGALSEDDEGAFEDEDYQPGAGDEEDIDFEDDDDEGVGGWGDVACLGARRAPASEPCVCS